MFTKDDGSVRAGSGEPFIIETQDFVDGHDMA